MKKVQRLLCLLTLASTLFLLPAGCSSPQNPAATPSPTASPAPAVYSLPDNITVDEIRARGGAVDTHGTLENRGAIDAFVTSFYAKIPEEALLVRYTVEGDPIFYQLIYNGDSITCFMDTRQDKFGNPEIIETKATSIVKVETDDGTSYQLTGTGNDPYELVTVLKAADQ